MGKKSPKQPVDTYYMSMHTGICVGPATLLAWQYGEKEAWSGNLSGYTSVAMNQDQLFGGPTKEGGVRGTFHFLPGKSDQVFPVELATKLGRTGVGDMPGYRGMASVFFTNGGAAPGFYWSANTPYLKPLSFTVKRKSSGLDPDKAFISYGEPTPMCVFISFDTSATMATGTRFATMIEGLKRTMDLLGAQAGAGGIIYLGMCNFGDAGFLFSGGLVDAALITAAKAYLDGMPLIPSQDSDWAIAAGVGLGQLNFMPGGIGKRLWILVTDGGPSRAFAPFTTQQNITDEAIAIRDAYPAAKTYVIDLQVDDSAGYSPQLDDTPEDGVPVVSGSDPTELEDALSAILFDDYNPAADSNPANIIYECLTNTDWGMGAPETILDLDSFNYAQDYLFVERFGLSFLWVRQTTIEAFVGEVLDHIQATLFVNPRTGLLTLKLIRNDYDIGDLLEINKNNAVLSKPQRKIWGEIVNEVQVTWTNPLNEGEETVTWQDLGAVAMQGGEVIPGSRNYYGVRNPDLAMKLAVRDLRASAYPFFACDAVCDRRKFDLVPGAVVKLNWPEYGITQMAMRVSTVSYGKAGDRSIKASLVEDVFAYANAEFETPPSTAWEDPSTTPTSMDFSRVITAPYYFVVQDFDVASVEYPEAAAAVFAADAAPDCSGYTLMAEGALTGGGTGYISEGVRDNLGRGELSAVLNAEVTSTGVAFVNRVGATVPQAGGFVFIGNGDEADMEICLVTAAPGYTLQRGALDTIPKPWPSGTPCWFVGPDASVLDSEIRADGESINYKLLTRTSLGELPEASASVLVGAITDRPWRPLRPANVKIDGVGFGEVTSLDDAITVLALTWSNRNRALEDTVILSWTAATVAPETGQTTTVTLINPIDDSIINVTDGLTGTSYNIPKTDIAPLNRAIVRITSKRDGYESFTGFELAVTIDTVSADSIEVTADSTLYSVDAS